MLLISVIDAEGVSPLDLSPQSLGDKVARTHRIPYTAQKPANTMRRFTFDQKLTKPDNAGCLQTAAAGNAKC